MISLNFRDLPKLKYVSLQLVCLLCCKAPVLCVDLLTPVFEMFLCVCSCIVGLLTPFWDVKWVFAEVRGPLLAT